MKVPKIDVKRLVGEKGAFPKGFVWKRVELPCCSTACNDDRDDILMGCPRRACSEHRAAVFGFTEASDVYKKRFRSSTTLSLSNNGQTTNTKGDLLRFVVHLNDYPFSVVAVSNMEI